MQDQLSNHLLSAFDHRASKATGIMVKRTRDVRNLLEGFKQGRYPIKVSPDAKAPVTLDDVRWVKFFHLDHFTQEWRRTFGRKDNTYLERLMEDEILDHVRENSFDVIEFTARNLVPGHWPDLDDGYKSGQCNIARAVINAAIRIGSDPATRHEIPVFMSPKDYYEATKGAAVPDDLNNMAAFAPVLAEVVDFIDGRAGGE